jgi:translation initiation factor eIF-2B subunit alpha
VVAPRDRPLHVPDTAQVVLVHGYSRVVLAILLHAAKSKNFSVVVTEGRAVNGSGYTMIDYLSAAKIPTTLILDSAVACVLLRASL